MTKIICVFLGILCLGYFIGIWAYAGLSAKFPFIWLGMGLVFLGAAFLLRAGIRLPRGFSFALGGGFLLLLFLFLGIEFCMVRAMLQRPEKGLDYIIVLGAQVKGERPSQSLLYRIEAAEAYLKENPESKGILSGGQGKGEGISEAECMARVLEKEGISRGRLFLEDQSASTSENIAFSQNLLKEKLGENTGSLKIGIVTNSFHIFRSQGIAEKKMDCQIQGIPAKSNPFLQPNYMLREFLGIIKDKWAGNM